jgi:hypothetical protein
MKIEFKALLTGSAAITALVPAVRINWRSQTQGAGNPYIVLQTISGSEGLTMNGPDGLFEGRVQIDVYGQIIDQVEQISEAVKGVLHGYRGGGFRLIRHVGEREDREGGSNEPERLFRSGLDFTVAWRAKNVTN